MKKYFKLLPLFVLVFTVGLVGHSLMAVKANEAETIPDTVYIGDMEVSGMTAREAKDAMDAYMDGLMDAAFTLDTGEKNIQVSAKELGISIANPEVVDEALNLGKTGNLIARYKDRKDLEREPKRFEIAFDSKKDTIANLLASKEENLNQEPIDSTLSREDGEFVLVEGMDGIKVDIDKSVQMIRDYLSQEWNGADGRILLATEVTKPRSSKEELSRVKDVLGSFHTDFSSSAPGRYKNVQNGANKINGSLIFPGEQFSVYEAVSPFDAENGYELAGSYENGTTVQTYGGGICQVSTTLYNAVILSELQIDERFNHSMTVAYVKPSMDAAIAGTAKDLKFTNNTDAPIYIEGYTSGGQIYFTVYGEESRPSNRTIRYESETISQTDPGVTIQPDGSQGVGYVATLSSAHTGYTARLWKIVTVDGEEESRTEFNNSRYNPSNKVIAVGTATANPEVAAHMAAAIATGDEATIRNTAAALSGDPAAAAAAAAAQAAAQAAAAQAASGVRDQ